MGTQFISVDLIDPDPDQPRKNKPVEYLRDELALSIATRGMRNPIHIRENPDIPGRFWVINGECRWTAVSMFVKDHWEGESRDGFKVEGKDTFIEAKIFEYGENAECEVFVDQVMDNLVRLNMGTLETLRAINRAIYELDEPISIGDCAKAFGMTVATIEADLPILNLPELMLKEYDAGRLAKTVARKLAQLPKHQVEKAYGWAKNAKNTEGALKKIQAYLDKVNQLDLFDQVATNADSKEKKQAKASFGRLMTAIEKFSDCPYLTGQAKLLILVNSRKTTEIEQTAKEMQKIATTLLDELGQYQARKKSAVA